MKKFFIKIVIFISLLIVADFAMGFVYKLYDYTKKGAIHKMHLLMTKETPQLLILGSSRASHHYDPKLLGDSLGLEVINAGFDGLGTTIGYGIFTGISQRQYPKYIICEITPSFDIYEDNGSIRGLNNLNPYINNKKIKNLLVDADPTAEWKLKSNTYRLNSSLLRLFPSIISKHDDFGSGFHPLNKRMTLPKTTDETKKSSDKRKINRVKEKYLRKLIQDATNNGCKVFFTISPCFGGRDISYYQAELEIINDYDITIFNHLNESSIINDNTLFQDVTHMNVDGAEKYSKIIVSDIKDYIAPEK